MPQQSHAIIGQQWVNTTGQPVVLVLTEKKISMGTDSDVKNSAGQVRLKAALLTGSSQSSSLLLSQCL